MSSPTASGGVGQIVKVFSQTSYTVPTGGTWLVVLFLVQNDYMILPIANMAPWPIVRIVAGGTTITQSYSGYVAGFAYRIS
jgi:hypothetical protein